MLHEDQWQHVPTLISAAHPQPGVVPDLSMITVYFLACAAHDGTHVL